LILYFIAHPVQVRVVHGQNHAHLILEKRVKCMW